MADGCWITAGWDMNWYDVRPHATEIDALRYCAKEDMGRSTFFVPWGEELHDKHHISRQQPNDGQADG